MMLPLQHFTMDTVGAKLVVTPEYIIALTVQLLSHLITIPLQESAFKIYFTQSFP